MPTNDLNLPFKDKIIESKKLLKKQITDLPQRFAQLTQLIEAEIQQIEQEFADGKVADDKIETKANELQKIIQTLEDKEERWFELSSKME